MIPEVDSSRNLWKTLLRVAWLAIVVGCALELLLLAVAGGFGALHGLKPFIADLTQKISWSVIVCVGIAVGSAASKARDVAMGVLGFISAPVGFYAARAIHKGVAQALAVASQAPGTSAIMVALVKAIEYGVFGLALYWIQKRSWGVAGHVMVAVSIGGVFGAIVLVLTRGATPLPLAAVVSREINEIFFPVGCALVIYSTEVLKKRHTPAVETAASPAAAQRSGA